MMNAINKYIDTVEENFHSIFSKDEIEELVGYNYGYFNRKFKSITGMTPDKYRVRRQLSLIALEIKNNTGIIKKSNLLPWADESSFLKAFKREFNMTPSVYIKGTYYTLQEKVCIESRMEEEILLKTLVEEHKGYEGALKYLLGLNSDKCNGFILDTKYEKYIRLTNKYYDISEYLDMYDNSTDLLSLVYILAKGRLIENLITKIDTHKFLDPLDI